MKTTMRQSFARTDQRPNSGENVGCHHSRNNPTLVVGRVTRASLGRNHR